MSLPNFFQNFARSFILAFCLLASVSCTFVDIRNDKSLYHNGILIDREVLSQVKVGQTKTQWLLENLGYPSEINTNENGDLHYVYYFKERHIKSSKVFLIFQYRTTQMIPVKTVIMSKNDLVTQINSSQVENES